MVNSVSFVDGRKLKGKYCNYFRMRAISDGLCRSYGLSVPSREQNRKKQRIRQEKEKKGRVDLMTTAAWDVDRAVLASLTWAEFLENLGEMGYEITWKNRKGEETEDLRLRMPDGRNFFLLYNLGEVYEKDRIIERILRNRVRARLFTKEEEIQQKNESIEWDAPVSGMRGLYLRYAQELNLISRDPGSARRLSLFLRQDLIRKEEVERQAGLLEKYGVETREDLIGLREKLEEEEIRLAHAYTRLSTAISRGRRKGNTERVRPFLLERAELTPKIRENREEKALCLRILERQEQTARELTALAGEREKGEEHESIGRTGRTGREDLLKRN